MGSVFQSMWHLPRNITLDNHKIDSVENEEIKMIIYY